MAYTVDDAVAAVECPSGGDELQHRLVHPGVRDHHGHSAGAAIRSSGTHLPTHDPEEGAVEHVAEEPWTPIKGSGPLFRGYPTPLLGNLNTPLWDADKFKCQRGGGPSFYLGVDIEPVITFVGPVSISPPAFARSVTQRLGLLSRKHYRGVCAFQPQLRFSIQLNEDPANPKLTGTITPDPSLPGAIRLPATIEVVLESLVSFTVQQRSEHRGLCPIELLQGDTAPVFREGNPDKP